jgi:hypothetical protein
MIFLDHFDYVFSGGYQPARGEADVSTLRLASFGTQIELNHVVRADDFVDHLQHFRAIDVASKWPSGLIRTTSQRIEEVVQGFDDSRSEVRLARILHTLNSGADSHFQISWTNDFNTRADYAASIEV